jgi:hypothetical protein
MSGGCSGNDEASKEASAAPADEAPADDWSERLADEPITAVLASMARPHAEVRDAIGPHRLHYESSFSMQPQPANDPLPPLDDTVPESFDIHDELTLLWRPDEDDGPRFSLSQHNDAGRGRDVVAAKGRLYTKLEYRPWQWAPVESEVHELWLDDAWRGPGDVLALAAPWLALTPTAKEGAGLDGGDAIAFAVSMADHRDDDRVPEGWRGSATFDEISGEVVLDARTGAWLSADLTLRYAVPAASGRKARGLVKLQGSVEPASKEAAITVPKDAERVFERTRYEVERAQLLDGLAAP